MNDIFGGLQGTSQIWPFARAPSGTLRAEPVITLNGSSIDNIECDHESGLLQMGQCTRSGLEQLPRLTASTCHLSCRAHPRAQYTIACLTCADQYWGARESAEIRAIPRDASTGAYRYLSATRAAVLPPEVLPFQASSALEYGQWIVLGSPWDRGPVLCEVPDESIGAEWQPD